MARGAESKEAIISKILEVFPNAFKYDKELRIPMMEGGEEVQIKLTLTAAKTNVEHDSATEVVGTVENIDLPWEEKPASSPAVNTPQEPSEEEKENIRKMMAALF